MDGAVNSHTTVLIKIGGRAMEDETALVDLLRELAELFDNTDMRFLLVHGGGAEVSRISKIMGMEPVFKDGKRITSPEEMPVIEMVLSGSINKKIVRLANTCGLVAVGISGADASLFTASALSEDTRTGMIDFVNNSIVENLLSLGYFPVISPCSVDSHGNALNINADDAALALARSMSVDALVFISDIPGILKEDKVLTRLSASSVEKEIASGTISGGMIPKVRASVEALKSGVSHIVISNYINKGDFASLMEGKKGTTLSLEADL
ncbi:acetylglutamate kinase [Spirochaetia bacterium 38H-sp]|uniref:Acetylglutamate kinase n=1 Tax=Rarispira pelagica TaxID=3141764 RepID=A0ABU9U8E8_9SPIR